MTLFFRQNILRGVVLLSILYSPLYLNHNEPWIETGDLFTIKINMTIDEVIENLGEPLYIDAQSDQDEEIITKHLYYNFRTKQYKTESPPETVAISESDIFWGRRTILQFTFIEDHLIGWEEDKLIFNMADTDKKSGSLLKYFGLLLNIILTAKVFSM